MTHNFVTSILDPVTDDFITVEVSYKMRDIGVTMRPDENVQPVILSVAQEDGANGGNEPRELLQDLTEDDLIELRLDATIDCQDRMDETHFGT